MTRRHDVPGERFNKLNLLLRVIDSDHSMWCVLFVIIPFRPFHLDFLREVSFFYELVGRWNKGAKSASILS